MHICMHYVLYMYVCIKHGGERSRTLKRCSHSYFIPHRVFRSDWNISHCQQSILTIQIDYISSVHSTLQWSVCWSCSMGIPTTHSYPTRERSSTLSFNKVKCNETINCLGYAWKGSIQRIPSSKHLPHYHLPESLLLLVMGFVLPEDRNVLAVVHSLHSSLLPARSVVFILILNLSNLTSLLLNLKTYSLINLRCEDLYTVHILNFHPKVDVGILYFKGCFAFTWILF